MKHPFMKWIGRATWLISALVTINVGLSAFQYDFFKSEFAMMNLSGVMMPIYYIILASGLMCLFWFVMACMGECGCSSCNGKCK